MDATQLSSQFPDQRFTDVVFNAPRATTGWHAETGQLIDDTLQSSSEVLQSGGAVRFSAGGGMPGVPRLNGYANGGTPTYPIPEGFSTPEVTPYSADPNFGVPYTPRNNAGVPLPSGTENMDWYNFTCHE